MPDALAGRTVGAVDDRAGRLVLLGGLGHLDGGQDVVVTQPHDSLDRTKIPDPHDYPFCIPAMRGLDELELHRGDVPRRRERLGKSTLIEAIAVARLQRRGRHARTSASRRATRESRAARVPAARARAAAPAGRLLPARRELLQRRDRDRATPERLAGRRYGGRLAARAVARRVVPRAAAHRFAATASTSSTSPRRRCRRSGQLALLAIMHELVSDGSQFVIATQSQTSMSLRAIAQRRWSWSISSLARGRPARARRA